MRKWLVIAGAAALAGGLATGAGPALASAPQLPSAHVWITTPDGGQKMTDAGEVAFHAGASANLTVTVDPSRTYQRMDGFGASITDSSACVLYRLAPQQPRRDHARPVQRRPAVFLRQPMGASDFVDGPYYTYDDLPPGPPTTACTTSRSTTTRSRSCRCCARRSRSTRR